MPGGSGSRHSTLGRPVGGRARGGPGGTGGGHRRRASAGSGAWNAASESADRDFETPRNFWKDDLTSTVRLFYDNYVIALHILRGSDMKSNDTMYGSPISFPKDIKINFLWCQCICVSALMRYHMVPCWHFRVRTSQRLSTHMIQLQAISFFLSNVCSLCCISLWYCRMYFIYGSPRRPMAVFILEATSNPNIFHFSCCRLKFFFYIIIILNDRWTLSQRDLLFFILNNGPFVTKFFSYLS